MQTDQARFLLNSVFIPGLNNEHQITKRVFAAIPAEKCDHRIDPISKSALELAWHIVGTEMRFMDSVAAGAFDLSSRPRPESIRTTGDLLTWYGENFEARVAKVKEMPDEALVKIIDFRGMFQLPAVMYLNFVISHTIHHRGQLSMYLRPMGAKVPAIYGESFDSAEARKAAQAQTQG